ncbi:hypothetical protein BJX63DRAFT_437569 [Aspergillus granulosus]|uniref:ATPase AAA-type core domain-containing protein n=1 Tax=Aspergillus granulosus TaxID=176169 RepID=A0ABR4GUK6_9EURO
MIDIEALREAPVHQNTFKDLQIDESPKRMVKSLVMSHFRKKQIQKQQATIGMNQDLIKGKGSGLVILLHGVPGVGKTTIAEAVAQAHKKPLFAITRVFLRALKYYSSILFLTTNCVRTLDEALKSRIHVSLYHPPLSEEQTPAIFKANIQKHYNNHEPHERWNGSQTRNTFQIAHSLSQFDLKKTSLESWEDENDDLNIDEDVGETDSRPQQPLTLNYEQFNIVAETIEKFGLYLYDTMDSTPGDHARILNLLDAGGLTTLIYFLSFLQSNQIIWNIRVFLSPSRLSIDETILLSRYAPVGLNVMWFQDMEI